MRFPKVVVLLALVCASAFAAPADTVSTVSAATDSAKVDSADNMKKQMHGKTRNAEHVFKDDADQDGIRDSLDKCPNTPKFTMVDSVGCPVDLDADGVADDKDYCPNTPKGVKVDSTGCPVDSDKDGVSDDRDKCPNTPQNVHQVDVNGCPRDSDKDSVFDEFDKCPNTPQGTIVDERGCPRDSDVDGVYDGDDKCPDTPKGVMVDSVGCPFDSDKDGVKDYKDECPNTLKGFVVDSVGCPIDEDGDGVLNEKDKCPNTVMGVPVDSVGCPLNKRQDLNQLRRGINFKTNSAELTANSTPTLDDIVKLLNEFEDANLEIQGHTDNVGEPEYNKYLSQNRAKSVVDYLVAHGIAPERLRSAGYGQERPVADNNTAAGRAKNRRVELIPFYKDEAK